MRGDPDSCGVWAPCLSHADGQFWLVYTDVKRHDGTFKDAHNYIVTAPAIEGPWSDPVYVNSTGFDPSLFHDDDGRKWFVNMLWDHRRTEPRAHLKHPAFAGIVLQEYDPVSRQAGRPGARTSSPAPRIGLVEGPHLYKRNGWYYLITAEGGTGYDHAVTMARSRTHRRALRAAPERTSDHRQGRAGRAAAARRPRAIVETPDGRSIRPPLLAAARRPAALAARARDGDPEMRMARRRLALSGAGRPGRPRSTSRRRRDEPRSKPRPQRATFSPAPACRKDFQWLRTPEPERIFSLSARPGRCG